MKKMNLVVTGTSSGPSLLDSSPSSALRKRGQINLAGFSLPQFLHLHNGDIIVFTPEGR